MNSLQHFFMNAWRWHLGMDEIEEYIDANAFTSVPDIDEIKKQSFGMEFVELMNNRMVMGFFRYGNRHTRKNATYHYINSALRRLTLYNETGNTELLVDAANLLRMEFEIPQHPNAHFKSIDDGEHSHNIK